MTQISQMKIRLAHSEMASRNENRHPTSLPGLMRLRLHMWNQQHSQRVHIGVICGICGKPFIFFPWFSSAAIFTAHFQDHSL